MNLLMPLKSALDRGRYARWIISIGVLIAAGILCAIIGWRAGASRAVSPVLSGQEAGWSYKLDGDRSAKTRDSSKLEPAINATDMGTLAERQALDRDAHHRAATKAFEDLKAAVAEYQALEAHMLAENPQLRDVEALLTELRSYKATSGGDAATGRSYNGFVLSHPHLRDEIIRASSKLQPAAFLKLSSDPEFGPIIEDMVAHAGLTAYVEALYLPEDRAVGYQSGKASSSDTQAPNDLGNWQQMHAGRVKAYQTSLSNDLNRMGMNQNYMGPMSLEVESNLKMWLVRRYRDSFVTDELKIAIDKLNSQISAIKKMPLERGGADRELWKFVNELKPVIGIGVL